MVYGEKRCFSQYVVLLLVTWLTHFSPLLFCCAYLKMSYAVSPSIFLTFLLCQLISFSCKLVFFFFFFSISYNKFGFYLIVAFLQHLFFRLPEKINSRIFNLLLSNSRTTQHSVRHSHHAIEMLCGLVIVCYHNQRCTQFVF